MHVRIADPNDALAIHAIYEPIVRETHISFEESAPAVDEMSERIRSHSALYPWLVAVDGSDVVGYAYGSAHRPRAGYRWSVESSVYVHPRNQGKGIARKLYARLFEILTAQRFHAVFAGIALPNDASIALHRSMGFNSIGVFPEVGFKFGSWIDTSWWSLRLASPGSQIDEPIPFPQIRASFIE